MTRQEAIALAKELSELNDLTKKRLEVAALKKEARFINRLDVENYAEQSEIDEFNYYYNIVASKEGSLLASAYDEKKNLIGKAKQLLSATNFKKASADLNEIVDEFKSAGRCTKEQDDELWTEFRAVKDEFFAKRQKYFDDLKATTAKNKEAKQAIVEKAKAALLVEDMKEANAIMTSLMNEWKAIGFAGKEDDDKLWNEFQEARKSFFDKRQKYFDDMQSVFADRAAKKEELIKKAKIVLANCEFVQSEVDQLKALREEWKKIGFAGKEKDDELWNTFNSVINKYFEESRKYR